MLLLLQRLKHLLRQHLRRLALLLNSLHFAAIAKSSQIAAVNKAFLRLHRAVDRRVIERGQRVVLHLCLLQAHLQLLVLLFQLLLFLLEFRYLSVDVRKVILQFLDEVLVLVQLVHQVLLLGFILLLQLLFPVPHLPVKILLHLLDHRLVVVLLHLLLQLPQLLVLVQKLLLQLVELHQDVLVLLLLLLELRLDLLDFPLLARDLLSLREQNFVAALELQLQLLELGFLLA